MWPIKTARSSHIRDRISAFRTMRLLLAMRALLFVFWAASAFAQMDPPQFIGRNPSGTQTVSRNQLLAPGKAVRAIQRAQKYIVGGQLQSARKEIAGALDIAPHFAIAEVMQGAIDLKAENYDGAANLFQQAIDDDPALGGAYLGMSVVLIHQGRFQTAVSLLDRAERLLPDAWFVHFAKGWAQMETGNPEAALKQAGLAERIARADSERRSGASYLRAMVSIHIKDVNSAREHLAEAVSRDPGGQYASLAQIEIHRLQPILAAKR
jgi:tetratricopeptide (TPR) repeat protein